MTAPTNASFRMAPDDTTVKFDFPRNDPYNSLMKFSTPCWRRAELRERQILGRADRKLPPMAARIGASTATSTRPATAPDSRCQFKNRNWGIKVDRCDRPKSLFLGFFCGSPPPADGRRHTQTCLPFRPCWWGNVDTPVLVSTLAGPYFHVMTGRPSNRSAMDGHAGRPKGRKGAAGNLPDPWGSHLILRGSTLRVA